MHQTFSIAKINSVEGLVFSPNTEVQQERSTIGPTAHVHGFDLLERKFIGELGIEVSHYRHSRLGTEVYFLHEETPVTHFAVTFNSLPSDHSGLGHILEHVAIMHDPQNPQISDMYRALTLGSHYTENNASTSASKIQFYVSSQYSREAQSQAQILTSMVFSRQDASFAFQQEGWHVKKLKNGHFCFDGVVLNEMKEYYAHAETHKGNAILAALFPDTPYRFDSGGHPLHVFEATYERMQELRDRELHPGEAQFIVHGACNQSEYLQFLDQALQPFSPRTKIERTIKQQPFLIERDVVVPIPCTKSGIESESGNAIAWALPEHFSSFPWSWINVYQRVMLTPGTGLLAQALEKQFPNASVDCGLISGSDRVVVYVEVSATSEISKQRLRRIVNQELYRICAEEIPAALRQSAEQGVRETIRSVRLDPKRGLLYAEEIGGDNGAAGDPLKSLVASEDLNLLEAAYRLGRTPLESIIRDGMLENSHSIDIRFRPDPSLLKKWAQEERQILREMRESLGKKEFDKLVIQDRSDKANEVNHELSQVAQRPSAVTLEELRNRSPSDVVGYWIDDNRVYASTALRPTDHFALDIVFDLRYLPVELRPYASLVSELITTIGSTGVPAPTRELLDTASGIEIESSICSSRNWNSASSVFALFVDVSGPRRSIGYAADRLLSLLERPDLEDRQLIQQRVRDILLEKRASVESGDSWMVMRRAESAFSREEQLVDQFFGIGSLAILERWNSVLSGNSQRERSRFFESLSLTWKLLTSAPGTKMHLFHDPHGIAEALQYPRAILDSLSSRTNASEGTQRERPRGFSELKNVASSVSTLGVACILPRIRPDQLGAMSIFTHLVEVSILGRELRDRGSSYGISAGYDEFSQVLSMGSRSDNHPLRSFKVILEIERRVKECELTQSVLEMLKMGALRQHDLPQSSLDQARGRFASELKGRSQQSVERDRELIFSVNKRDIYQLAELTGAALSRGALVALASAGQNRALMRELKRLKWPVRSLE